MEDLPQIPVVGIDVGESTCCMATIVNGHPHVIPNEHGDYVTPSVVLFDSDTTTVGKPALSSAFHDPASTVYGMKHCIGRALEHPRVKELLDRGPWSIIYSDGYPQIEIFNEETDDDAFHIHHGSYTPQQVVTIILEHLRKSAETHFNVDATGPRIKAVLSVPAHFGVRERRATMEAGFAAGFDVLGLINAPTAAALAYGFRKNETQKVLVYDFGGGCVEAALVAVTEGREFKILGAESALIGGEDIDACLIDHVLSQFQRQHNFDELENIGKLKARLRLKVKDAKHSLVNAGSRSHIVVPRFYRDKDLSVTLTKNDLDRLCGVLFIAAMKPIHEILRDADFDVDVVVLCGGGSRMGRIRELIQERLPGVPISRDVNPEEAVAIGTALWAKQIAELALEISIEDRLSNTIYLKSPEGPTRTLISRGTALPASVTEIFITENQGSTVIPIVEAEYNISQIIPLGTWRFVCPAAELTFRCNKSGVLDVTARDSVSGRAVAVKQCAKLQRSDSDESFEYVDDVGLEP
ncbi:uncharacterized protein LOC129595811 [Paramacrobiotus metropolitanus]|uniref:uncharacterized protein LOC129595811 n=1 Tax=Paramacrobiotus metropolitanus TaxID=2943436 RepID=UPI002445ABA9|nr:uncharacterized protein LOC129595811 [Paramacrobiotus metropolitanus]XP_055348896.1 uncharacterized protein LOC129595811 [Paramacrobiotus metropolitanus]XP_055348897.1 uncharacterized protein LOC129595811 [Paramacrobiotus metropolitanus]